MTRRFIYRVTTFADTEKTQKGRILKEYVDHLANTLLVDDRSMLRLQSTLKEAVDHLNGRFPRVKEWKVSLGQGQIHVEPKDNDRRAFDSQALAIISFSNVRTDVDSDYLDGMLKELIASDDVKEGGAR